MAGADVATAEVSAVVEGLADGVFNAVCMGSSCRGLSGGGGGMESAPEAS